MSFQQIMEDYGADYHQTMARFMNNQGMYLRLMDMLFRDKNMGLLKESLANGDLGAAFEAAHALKGVSANMGLTPFYNAVSVIVEPLRARQPGADYPAMLARIQTEFARLPALRDALKAAAGK